MITTIDEKMQTKFPEYFSQDNLLESQKETSETVVDEFTLTIDGSDLIFWIRRSGTVSLHPAYAQRGSC